MTRHFLLPFALVAAAFALAATTAAPTTATTPKTFEEKEKIAVEMKKISKQLDVKCEYCHSDSERGLKEGDFTLLTKEGEYAHEIMFPISHDFKVECSYCHMGGDEMTKAGKRAHEDIKFMRRYRRDTKKKLMCKTCHIPGEPEAEFAKLTKQARKLLLHKPM